MREEDLELKILEKDKSLNRDQLNKLVEEKLKASPFLTRRGALLIILEEKRLAQELLTAKNYAEHIPIANLTAGLQNVSVRGRILGLKTQTTSTGRDFVKMRISDGTGSVDVYSDQHDLFKNLSVGEVVSLKNCSVSSLFRKRGLLLRTTSKTVVEKILHSPVVPSLFELVSSPQQAARSGREHVDVTAVVLLETTQVVTGEKTRVRHIVITDGEDIFLLHAYNEHCEAFTNSVKKRFVGAKLQIRGEEFHAFSDTFVTFLENDVETYEKGMKKALAEMKLIVSGVCVDGVPVAAAGGKLFRAPCLSKKDVGKVFNVSQCFILMHRGIPHLYCSEISESPEATGIEPVHTFRGDLEKVDGRLLEGQLTVEFLRKTELATTETRFGPKSHVRFWVKVGSKILGGMAWGEAAVKVSEFDEGSRVALAFPVIKQSRFGELEITIDSLTAFC